MKEIWPQLRERWKGALKRYQYVLLVMAAGVLLMMLPMGPSGGSEEAQGPPEGKVSSTWSCLRRSCLRCSPISRGRERPGWC